MASQAPPPLSDAQGTARRRGRMTVGRAAALAATVAVVLLFLVPQLNWMRPLSSCYTPQRQQHQPVTITEASDRQEQQQQGAEADFELPPGFQYNKVVVIVAFDRFEYFRQVVEALRQAWGSEEYVVAIFIDGPPEGAAGDEGQQQQQQASEPGDGGAGSSGYNAAGRRAIVAYAQQLQWLARSGRGGFRDVVVNASDTNLGVWPNKKRAVAGALALSDFVVVLEDDIVVERDALRWFEWHVTSGLIFRRPEIAVATCWSTSFPYHPSAVEAHDLLVAQDMGLLDKYWVDHWAQPWGWATWRRTWDAVGAGWNGRDVRLAQAIQKRGWFETMPLVARCNNIGAVGAHKKGKGVGHIHQRALTSAAFSSVGECAYRELPRANNSAPLDREPLYNQVARRGLLPDTKQTNVSMAEHRAALQRFMADHPEPSGWRSSC